MKKEKYSKDEINNLTKNIEKMKITGHKHEKFKQVIYIKKGQDISEGIYLPYLISSYGRLFSLNYRSKKGVIQEISTKPNKDGYYHIILYHKGKKYNARINRLVCTAFKKNKNYSKYVEVNHKNSNPSDDYSWNLEWCTAKRNIRYSFKHGNRKNIYGEDSNRSKYKNSEIKHVCELLQSGLTYKEISEITGVSYDTIYNIFLRRQWCIISCKYDFSTRPYKSKKR